MSDEERPSYTKEFKLEAVRLLERGGEAADLAREFGIRRNQLCKWQEQLRAKSKEDFFSGHGRRAGAEAEVAPLKRDMVRPEEEKTLQKQPYTSRRNRREVSVHGGSSTRTPDHNDVGSGSRSGDHGWRARPASRRERKNRQIFTHIQTIHACSREAYGVIETEPELREQGEGAQPVCTIAQGPRYCGQTRAALASRLCRMQQ